MFTAQLYTFTPKLIEYGRIISKAEYSRLFESMIQQSCVKTDELRTQMELVKVHYRTDGIAEGSGEIAVDGLHLCILSRLSGLWRSSLHWGTLSEALLQ